MNTTRRLAAAYDARIAKLNRLLALRDLHHRKVARELAEIPRIAA